MHHTKLFILLLSLCFSLPAFALSSDKDQPIEMAADGVDVDEAKALATYKGNVELVQGSMRLNADTVTVKRQPNKTHLITAIGKVRFSQKSNKGPVTATANKAEYQAHSELLRLIGKAKLTQNGDTIRSDRITYDRARHKVKAGAAAKGKERVRITIPSLK